MAFINHTTEHGLKVLIELILIFRLADSGVTECSCITCRDAVVSNNLEDFDLRRPYSAVGRSKEVILLFL